MKRLAATLFLCLLGVTARAADDASQILVTFSDPGLSNASRPGPARPGYSRRSSTYLVSIGVRRAADRLARDFNLSIVDEWPIVALDVHCLVYAVADDDAVDRLLVELRQRPEVESAQRMNRFEVLESPVAGGTDPYAALQNNFELLGLAEAHTWSRGDGSRVTIIDTGADIHHPELESQVDEHVDFVEATDESFVTDAHGTAVAGLIGAASDNGVGTTGVAPSARLEILKACWYAKAGGAAVCNSFTLAKALSHAIDKKPQVINLSLGGPPDPLLARLLEKVLANGAIVVAADPPDGNVGFPATVPGVIVVGSADARESAIAAIAAPGREILVLKPGGGYDYASGSSLSAAQVSGIAALLVSRRPGLSADDVRRLLIGSRADDQQFVNACRALASLLNQSGCSDADAVSGVLSQQLETGGQADDEL